MRLMRQRAVVAALIPVLAAVVWSAAARATNFLEIDIFRDEATGSSFHEIWFGANKDGATTCELATPSGAYSCVDVGEGFLPEQAFFDDHRDLSFAALEAAIASVWTITWDAGPTQSIATIDFGTVLEADFLAVPILTSPVDGMPIEIPADPNPPTIEWMYEGIGDPCAAQPDYVAVNVADHALWWLATAEQESDELPCDATSWTPDLPLGEGTWFTRVANNLSFRPVPDGISVTEGSWTLENGDWLQLHSVDKSQNLVVPTESTSWGAVKARF